MPVYTWFSRYFFSFVGNHPYQHLETQPQQIILGAFPQHQMTGYPQPQVAGYPQPHGAGYPQPQAAGYPQPQVAGYLPQTQYPQVGETFFPFTFQIYNL